MSWQRARSDEQKAERLRASEEAAAALFLERKYHEITMAQIAERAGFTRPNLYRYYAGKEAIFLALLGRELDRWIEEMESNPPAAGDTVEGFASWWVSHFTSQPRLPRLLPLMSTSLDENSGEASLREFKVRLAAQSARIGRVLLEALPWYPPDSIAEFAVAQLALVTGFMPMATRGEMHQRILEEENLSDFAIDFGTSYKRDLVYWLHGVRATLASGR
jgi:AcrR family transcriptional regulator